MGLEMKHRLTYDEVKEILNICRNKHGAYCMDCPLYKKRDCIEILTDNALSIIECQASENKRLEMCNSLGVGAKQMSDKEDIYYLVALKDNIADASFYKTTVSRMFCGKLVNNNGANFYFELNGSDALVIIPHSWIEWMAPSKILWEHRKKVE